MTMRVLTATLVMVVLLGCAGVGPPPSASANPAPATAAPGRPTAPAVTPAPPAPPATAVPAGPHGALLVENMNLHVGDVKEGDDAVGVFKLKNTGDAELKILSAKPG